MPRRRKPTTPAPEKPAAETTAPANEGCQVSVKVIDDDLDFQQVYDSDGYVATCERCSLSSTKRTSEAKAKNELAQLCAERLAGNKADPED